MVRNVVIAAALATLMSGHVAAAQTVTQIGNPAEMPPAGFKGDQFIDSRGCVFMRISAGGKAQWYPRVDGNHKVVCGYPPTFGAHPQVAVAATPQPVAPAAKPATAAKAPAAVAAAAPATKPAAAAKAPAVAPVVAAAPAKPAAKAPTPTVASAMVPATPPAAVAAAAPQPAPYVAQAPASYQVATSAAIPPGKIGCFRSAPVAEVVALRDGSTAVVCTRGDGTATGWRSPLYPTDAPVGAALRSAEAVREAAARPVQVAKAAPAAAPAAQPQPAAVAAAPTFTVPKGYKLAWDDDRLNPRRGQGTAQGWAQQDQVWTRTVPARLVNPASAKAPVYANANQLAVSSMNTNRAAKQAAPAASGALWVQVGSFGVPENASATIAQLQALGLPAGTSNITRGGKALQIVLAGPFASTAEAQAALQQARGAGFGDAFLR